MSHTVSHGRRAITCTMALAALVGWAAPGAAQTVNGQARAVQTTVVSALGTSTSVLSDTGTLSGTADARQASQPSGSVPSLVAGETLHATTIGGPDQVASEASIADLTITAGGVAVGADFVMSRALAVLGVAATGTSSISGLAINGAPVSVTGEPNQTIPLPGGRLIVNEQQASPGGLIVNALHLTLDGVADMVIASATATVR